MELTSRFLAYAADFERSYADRAWRRLASYFAPQAVYECTAPAELAFRVDGRDAILERFATATDAFDRRFDSRLLRLDSPRAIGQQVAATGVVVYTLAGAEPFRLRFAEVAEYRGSEIIRLEDSATAQTVHELGDWMTRYGSLLRA